MAQLESIEREVNMLCLPPEVTEKIFSYLSFCEVGRLRRSCRRLRDLASEYLNLSFLRLQRDVQVQVQSARPLLETANSWEGQVLIIRQLTLLEILQSEINVLHATCWRYVENSICCFFAAEILDEIQSLLWLAKDDSVTEAEIGVDVACSLFQFIDTFIGNFFAYIRHLRNPNLLADVISVLNQSLGCKLGPISVHLDPEECYVSTTFKLWGRSIFCYTKSDTEIMHTIEDVVVVARILIRLVCQSNRAYIKTKWKTFLADMLKEEMLIEVIWRGFVPIENNHFTCGHSDFKGDWRSEALDIFLGIKFPFKDPDEIFIDPGASTSSDSSDQNSDKRLSILESLTLPEDSHLLIKLANTGSSTVLHFSYEIYVHIAPDHSQSKVSPGNSSSDQSVSTSAADSFTSSIFKPKHGDSGHKNERLIMVSNGTDIFNQSEALYGITKRPINSVLTQDKDFHINSIKEKIPSSFFSGSDGNKSLSKISESALQDGTQKQALAFENFPDVPCKSGASVSTISTRFPLVLLEHHQSTNNLSDVNVSDSLSMPISLHKTGSEDSATERNEQ